MHRFAKHVVCLSGETSNSLNYNAVVAMNHKITANFQIKYSLLKASNAVPYIYLYMKLQTCNKTEARATKP